MELSQIFVRLVTLCLVVHQMNSCTAFRIRHQYSQWNKRHVGREMRKSNEISKHSKISFEAQNNTEIVAQIGGSANLKCFSQSMGEEIVTWLKRDDDQLLTAGPFVYSSENRYSVSHIKNQKLWELRIRHVMPSDAGTYECQLTTYPPVSILFQLKVVEAKAVIRGLKELHVHEGSRLKLRCHIVDATQSPSYVFWFHNNTMVNYVIGRPLKVSKQRYGSTLIISNVSRSDAGSYRCEPSLARADNITLHVLAGENSAAMQRGRDEENRQNNREENSSLASQIPSSSSTMNVKPGKNMVLLLCLLFCGLVQRGPSLLHHNLSHYLTSAINIKFHLLSHIWFSFHEATLHINDIKTTKLDQSLRMSIVNVSEFPDTNKDFRIRLVS